MTTTTKHTEALDFSQLWREAIPWADFLRPAMKHYALWDGVYRGVTLPEGATERAERAGTIHLLVLAEDWCGDAANTVPVLAALADATPGWSLRVLPRDEYPAVMDRYLTGRSRSIPIAIALDAEFRELGHWGPRPAELQAWVMGSRETMPRPTLYAETRRWYARDRGETTVGEVLGAVVGW